MLSPFDSLRSRHLLATVMLAVFVLAALYMAHYTVQQSKHTASSNITNRSEVLQLSRLVRESLLNTYSSMQGFLLEPNESVFIEETGSSLQKAEQYVNQLLGHEWVIDNTKEIHLKFFPHYLNDLSQSIDFLVKTRMDPFQQFPSLALSNREMRPYRNSFNNAISLSILEAESELTSAPESAEAYRVLVETRNFWTQMVSNYRLYIANRLGSFNEQALPSQEKSITTLYSGLTDNLKKLVHLDQQSKLGFETSGVLHQLIDSSKAWYLGFEETKKIHNSGNWRTDKNILMGEIEPQIHLLWDLLHEFDKVVEAAAVRDINLLSVTANRQENLLWGIAVGVFALLIFGFIYSERVIFNPIAKIASALRAEAAGRDDVILPSVSSRETRDLVEAFTDMKMQVRSRQHALEHNSLHDELTGLPNRTLIFERMHQSIISSKKSNTPFAVMILNVNNLKEVNDTLGHHVGDKLLLELGTRLEKNVIGSSTLAKIGGNEFAVLALGMDKELALSYAAILTNSLKKDVLLGEIDIHPEIRTGIAIYPTHGIDKNTLIQRADIAMLLAKQQHQSVMVYNEHDDKFSISRLGLLADIKTAINDNTLEMHYQPKLDIVSETVIGVEALLRWKHKEHGWVQASEIVSIAEQSGLIDSLTKWTFKEAVKQCAQWNSLGLNLNVAINLSVQTLHDESIADYIQQILRAYTVSPKHVTLEITESAMMTNPTKVSNVLRQLNNIGVSISADDFGTGFSSLSYLKKLPVNEIKIDKSFIMDMTRNTTDKTIVKSAIGLAHNLGLKVVAEGIEDIHTQEELQKLSCDVGQGYYFSKPLNSEAFLKWIKHTPVKMSV